MKIHDCIKKYYWWIPCCAYSADANAWGLFTHLYFAQSLLWAMPLLDPKLQAAIKRFPELVMAGACLPDLALIDSHFKKTHLWENAHRLINNAASDEETAIAIGYASHLYIDVIAHNHFVPAHEAMWFKNTMFTHITSEWAMDAYLSPLLSTSPHKLLTKHNKVLARFASAHFNCSENTTYVAIKRLALGDRLLRSIKLPQMIHAIARLLDSRINKHFIYYVAKTQTGLADIGQVLSGNLPIYDAELKNLSLEQLEIWRETCLHHLMQSHPQPIDYFVKPNKS